MYHYFDAKGTRYRLNPCYNGMTMESEWLI